MRSGEGPKPFPDVPMRVRRLATLRAAQRALGEVAEPGEFREALALGRKLLLRLRALSGGHARAESLDRKETLEEVDKLLGGLSGWISQVLATAKIPVLCASLAPLAAEESGAIRALAAVALEAEPESARILDVLEFLVALLSCEGPPGSRVVARSPFEVLPELANVSNPTAYEAHPDIDEAGQIFGRGVVRLEQDDLGATRDRMIHYKRRLGVRRLHVEVMAAAVAYDTAMANRLAEIRGDDFFDALAETVFGADALDPEAAEPSVRRRVVLPPAAQAKRSRLFWHSLATVGLSIGLLVLALVLWQRPSVEVIAEDLVGAISPHLIGGYLSADDGTPHFVGILGDSWKPLPLPERRRVVARIAALLESDGVKNMTLVNSRRAIQARHDGDTLLWVTAPAE